MKSRLWVIAARLTFYMTSNKPNLTFRIVDWSLYARRNACKGDYHKKQMDKFA